MLLCCEGGGRICDYEDLAGGWQKGSLESAQHGADVAIGSSISLLVGYCTKRGFWRAYGRLRQKALDEALW
jgi:hypothetical protein